MAVDYDLLRRQAKALRSDEENIIALLANFSSLIFHALPDLNWAGFYLRQQDTLILGPFQGQPACYRIPVGKGVCGTAVATNETQRVADVHRFPGHIACDAASNSEIVIPVRVHQQIVAVLDIDSPNLNRFAAADQAALEAMVLDLQQDLEAINEAWVTDV